jgi:hypothetical protein
MKPIFLEYSELSLALAEIAKLEKLDYIDAILGKSKIVIQKSSTLTELMEVVNSEESLFDDVDDTITLLDTQDIDLTPSVLLTIGNLNLEKMIYLMSTSQEGYDADFKKQLKKVGLEIISIKKPDNVISQEIAKNYAIKINSSAKLSKIELLANQCVSYLEIIDCLDFAELSGSPDSAIDSMLKEQKLGLFMRSFNPSNLGIKDLQPWIRDVDEGELQLALSLIYTKLNKLDSDRARELLSKLIEVDQKIKTRSKINPLIWYRLFLFEAMA